MELLVGATLSAALMAGVLSSYIYLGRSLGRLANQQSLDVEARRTLAYFTRDVQSASALTGTLSATSVAFLVPTSGTSNTVTYYFNDTSSSATVSINGTNVAMAANALTRCVYDGTNVTSVTLLRNITSSGLNINYYDGTGNAYTSYTNYLTGIKQLALQFSTQAGVAASGTQTLVYNVASSRLVLRNRPYLQ